MLINLSLTEIMYLCRLGILSVSVDDSVKCR